MSFLALSCLGFAVPRLGQSMGGYELGGPIGAALDRLFQSRFTVLKTDHPSFRRKKLYFLSASSDDPGNLNSHLANWEASDFLVESA